MQPIDLNSLSVSERIQIVEDLWNTSPPRQATSL